MRITGWPAAANASTATLAEAAGHLHIVVPSPSLSQGHIVSLGDWNGDGIPDVAVSDTTGGPAGQGAVPGARHIEGVGAGRREVAHLIDTLIWVQADERETGRRATARAANPPAADLANKAVDGAPIDNEGWMAEEKPFNVAQRTWERADIIICGTPEIPHAPNTELVTASPPSPARRADQWRIGRTEQ